MELFGTLVVSARFSVGLRPLVVSPVWLGTLEHITWLPGVPSTVTM